MNAAARFPGVSRVVPAIAVLGAMFFPAMALACAQWDLSGEWSAVQSNGSKPAFDLQQSGPGLQGSAVDAYIHKSECVLVACGDDYYQRNGSVDGTINGDAVELKSYWDNNTIGVYSGTIGSQGRIEGTSYDQLHPENRAEWYSDRTMKCLSDQPENGGAASSSSSALTSGAPPALALGRVQSSGAPPAQRIGDEPQICANARSAWSRNSPVAPQLEAACRAAGGSFTERTVTPMQSPSGSSVVSRPGLFAHGAAAAAPPRQEPAPPPASSPAEPGHVFAPPLFDDGARLWACAGAKNKPNACSGVRGGRGFCRTHGFSGTLQSNADGSPGVRLEAVRAGLPVRDIDGVACKTGDCMALAELRCAP